jgi:hypothetical protein
LAQHVEVDFHTHLQAPSSDELRARIAWHRRRGSIGDGCDSFATFCFRLAFTL